MKPFLLSVLVAATLVGCVCSDHIKHHSSIPNPAIPLPDDQDPDQATVYERLIGPAIVLEDQISTTDKRIFVFKNYPSAVFHQFSDHKNQSKSLLMDDHHLKLSGVFGEVSSSSPNLLMYGPHQTRDIQKLMQSAGASTKIVSEQSNAGPMGMYYNATYDLQFSRNMKLSDLRGVLTSRIDPDVRLVFPDDFSPNEYAGTRFVLVASFFNEADGTGYMSAHLVPHSQYDKAKSIYASVFNGSNLLFRP